MAMLAVPPIGGSLLKSWLMSLLLVYCGGADVNALVVYRLGLVSLQGRAGHGHGMTRQAGGLAGRPRINDHHQSTSSGAGRAPNGWALASPTGSAPVRVDADGEEGADAARVVGAAASAGGRLLQWQQVRWKHRRQWRRWADRRVGPPADTWSARTTTRCAPTCSTKQKPSPGVADDAVILKSNVTVQAARASERARRPWVSVVQAAGAATAADGDERDAPQNRTHMLRPCIARFATQRRPGSWSLASMPRWSDLGMHGSRQSPRTPSCCQTAATAGLSPRRHTKQNPTGHASF